MTKEKVLKFNKHWGIWAKGYLNLAKQGLLYFKNQRNLGKIKHFENQPKALFNLEDGTMLIASIWNIKHGIELLIKALGIYLDKRYWKKHELDFLLKDLEKKIKNYCIEEDFDMLKRIVEKYYKCQFYKKTSFIDYENTFFKYPETQSERSSYSIDYSFVHDISRKDINQFLIDIDNLHKIHDRLENQPKQFKSDKRWNIDKKETEKKLKKNYKKQFKK